jgi:redox-sensitive bicupin YhaK (pirin superfamily)
MTPTNLVDNAVSTRGVVFQTRGQKHGPITRLMSPSDLGERLRPFVFLDKVETDNASPRGLGLHPHSGIATITMDHGR